MKIVKTILVIILSGTISYGEEIVNPCELNEKQVIALTLLQEARSDQSQYNGMNSVAQCLLNRSRYKKLPLKTICLQKFQFSCWNTLHTAEYYNSLLFSKQGSIAWNLAEKIIKGIDVDMRVKRSLNYYANYISAPSWSIGYQQVIIGKHIFLVSPIDKL